MSDLNIGFYNYGSVIETEGMVEFWTGESVSFARDGKDGYVEIRNKGDFNRGIYIMGDGTIGSDGNIINFYINNDKNPVLSLDQFGNLFLKGKIFHLD